MTPQQIRGVTHPILYRNPFWSDPVDAAADPVIRPAAIEILEWQPVRQQRTRTALWIYAGLWLVEILLVLRFFAQTSDEDGERWGWPAGILLLALFFVIPSVLAMWVQPTTKRVQRATAIIRSGSVQRYDAWLAWLQQNDPAVYGQVVLWHQGNQANQLATAQLATQVYTAYQVRQMRGDIRNNR